MEVLFIQKLTFLLQDCLPLYLQLEMFSHPLLILQITKTMGPLYEN